jgi:hypothetical protein
MRLRALTLLAVSFVCSVAHARADDVIDGRVGPGALYRLVRPTEWNGSLVLFAHGGVASDAPIALPPEAVQIAGLLTSQHFAVALSSFSENGWALKDGVQRTHQLIGIFSSKFGLPTRIYVAGASLGGLIAIKLAEKYAHTFDGALPACAIAGGAQLQFDYGSHVRALFDFFYPDVLPGSAGEIPVGIDPSIAIGPPAVAAMSANPAGAFAIAAIDQTPVPFASLPELIESIATALVSHAALFNDVSSRTHGHPFFDNEHTIYTGALPAPALAAVNAGVDRFAGSPSAANYLDHNYTPSGDLTIPMLMLSTSRDPVAPGFNQTSYQQAVDEEGDPALLVQREIDRYGHCNFLPSELVSAFGALVAWVELGIVPTP